MKMDEMPPGEAASSHNLEDIFKDHDVPGLARALQDAMRSKFLQAAGAEDSLRRQYSLLLGFRDQLLNIARQAQKALLPERSPSPSIMSLAVDRTQAVQSALEGWGTLLERFRHAHRVCVRRRDYRDESCGDPPFREFGRSELRLREAQGQSLPDATGNRYEFAIVEPFVAYHRPRQRRAAEYRRWMFTRSITPADLRSDAEMPLVGQRGVFSVVPIPRGTCLGVYGGQLMRDAEVLAVVDDRYLMGLRSADAPCFVNGENIMSVTNTVFAYDATGRPCGHPAQGYNLARVVFPAQFSGGWHFGISAFIASEDIPAGAELRWNYELHGQ